MIQSNHLNKDGLSRTTSQLLNNVVTDLQQLTKMIKSHSKAAADVNASLINRTLLAGKDELVDIIKQLLAHILHMVEFKGISSLVIVILSKIISLIKIFYSDQEKLQKLQQKSRLDQQMEDILQTLIDILFVLNSRQRQVAMTLRIIQTTYSLIQPALLKYADYHLTTRIYAICLGCCLSTPEILSISASAIFSLTQIIFSNSLSKDLAQILTEFLELVMKDKKSQWAKDLELKGLIWDVVLIAVRSIPQNDLQQIKKNQLLVQLLNSMYRISLENSFSKNPNLIQHDLLRGSIQLENQKVRNQTHNKKDLLREYIKYYKTFVYFSIHLSLRLKEEMEIVPFRKNISFYHSLYDYSRSIRFYILLEGVSLIVSHGCGIILQEQGGIMLVDIFQKVCEDLYASKLPFQVVWESPELLLDKMFADYTKIGDQDYLKLTKNMLVLLRKSFERDKTHLCKEFLEESGDISVTDHKVQSKESGLGFRWRRLVKSVIRIIRYLTSLKFKQNSNDQAIRRFLMELQYWFVICPNNKTRNSILLELQHITNNVQDHNQAIKASQSMQICANILYGFYSALNSTGVSIIIRILANIKVSCQMGKDFNQLDEVCQMADRFYIEQKIITTAQQFHITIEGLILCLNLMVADLQVPSKTEDKGKDTKQITQKYLRLIDYVLYKFRFVMEVNCQFMRRQWEIIRCFWVSMCSNKQSGVRSKTMSHIESVLIVFLKSTMTSEVEIIDTYIELSKLDIEQISRQIIQHIKGILAYLKDQRALVSIATILQQLTNKRYAEVIRNQVSQLEEILIKDSLFKVKSQQYLLTIIDSLNFRGKSKNEQYVTVSLLWTIADHLKALYQDGQLTGDSLWKQLLTRLIEFAKETGHPGTRQSCIHTFTQILADCKQAIGEQLFAQLITKDYPKIYFLLMGFDQTVAKLESLTQVEMAKVAIKNFIKLAKKCLNEEEIYSQQLLKSTALKIAESVQILGKELPVQYYIQICQFIQFLKEIAGQKKAEEGELLIEKKEVYKIIQAMQVHHESFDQSSFIFNKKYLPHFTELKEYFAVSE